jgi:asparagine synthase (glutamine-hydrolysing)
VIDPAGGQQPMSSADERYVMVYNGEMYNFHSLREELEQVGKRFRTQSDTEVLLEAYGYWGATCLSKFHGMFALAVYDRVENELFLARDRTGIKPLYYATLDGAFCFASEIKALHELSARSLTLNYASLVDFLLLSYTVPPRTFFSEIHEVEPGSWLRVTRRGIERGTYWTWKREPADWNESVSLEAGRRAILESLSEQLVADVPIGAFLSGGIDSSLLLAMLVNDLGRKVPSFTVAFGETSYDESPYAAMVARHLGTDHHEIRVPVGQGNLALIDEVLSQFDQPFGDSSAVPSYLMCRAVRPFVKVVIGGDGGDEMFGGYPRYGYADFARTLGRAPAWALRAMLLFSHAVSRVSPSERVRQVQRLLRAADASGNERLLALSCYLFPEELQGMLTPSARQKTADYVPMLMGAGDRSRGVGGADFIDATMNTALPGDYLRKVDMMSSAHGLEVRIPFLGESVLACSARIPERWKYSVGENKRLLRKLAERYLPPAICRRPKAGFGFPFDAWLGDQGRRELHHQLCSPTARVRDIVSAGYLERLLRCFVEQRWDDLRISRYNLYQRVYCLWALERWLQRWSPNL